LLQGQDLRDCGAYKHAVTPPPPASLNPSACTNPIRSSKPTFRTAPARILLNNFWGLTDCTLVGTSDTSIFE
jgi:hypothetical protein